MTEYPRRHANPLLTQCLHFKKIYSTGTEVKYTCKHIFHPENITASLLLKLSCLFNLTRCSVYRSAVYGLSYFLTFLSLFSTSLTHEQNHCRPFFGDYENYPSNTKGDIREFACNFKNE